jgi:PAT family beta-lactamase induction signal transducer AmpG
VAIGALLVATASATQDIVVDAFRVESLPENEQAAGMASYVAAYRIGMLVSGAGTLVLVSWLQEIDFALQSAWTAAYMAMAVLVVIGMAASLAATEPEFSRKVEANHARRAGENPLRRAFDTAVRAFVDFLGQEMAVVVLIFVALFKLADAMAGTMNTPFFLQLGFSLAEIAAISKGVGFAATLAGGFAGGFIARAYPLPQALWIGALLQTFTILVFSGLALIGHDIWALTFSVAIWSFADALGTVIFVAYLSALCQSPLHTATQYALLTALASIGRTVFSSTTGFLVSAAGWFWFFVICTALAAPGLLMLAWLQRKGHFKRLEPKRG